MHDLVGLAYSPWTWRARAAQEADVPPRALLRDAILLDMTYNPVMTVPDLAHDASALHHVSLDDPPTLIMHGDQDPGVPLDQSVRLADTLKKVGVPVQLEIIKGAGHGGKEFQGADVRDALRRFLKQYLN